MRKVIRVPDLDIDSTKAFHIPTTTMNCHPPFDLPNERKKAENFIDTVECVSKLHLLLLPLLQSHLIIQLSYEEFIRNLQ